MQTIYLDLAQKNVTEHIHAKQGDVGRRFEAVILDNGKPYPIEHGTVFTVWYSGASGEGNYSSVGESSAILFHDNILQVELISQMLTNYGCGTMCLVMHKADGTQIGLWNLIYFCEPVPGMGSMEATKHYTALSEVAQKAITAAQTFATDYDLTFPGMAADAKAVGDALSGKAPNGFGVGSELITQTAHVADLNTADLKTGFQHCSAATKNVPDDSFGGGPLMTINWHDNTLCGQLLFNNDLTQLYFRTFKDGFWTRWMYLNPPVQIGVEYATMEKWNNQTVYTKLIDCGLSENGKFVAFGENLHIVRYSGTIGNIAIPAMIGTPGSAELHANFCVNHEGIRISCSDSAELSNQHTYCRIWYTKT